ncbi:MAG TPA: hypothetical protein VHE14_05840 [Solirubrobacteraceae bacterium]|nr:hypothetical protein [Solirubrobacteraceae bacterium]
MKDMAPGAEGGGEAPASAGAGAGAEGSIEPLATPASAGAEFSIEPLAAPASAGAGERPAPPALSGAEFGVDYPILGSTVGDPIPDLAAIDPSQWKAVLRPINPWAREFAIRRMDWRDLRRLDADVIVRELRREEAQLRRDGLRRAARADGLPSSHGTPRLTPRRTNRQLNVRLPPEHRERLEQAADLLGMSAAGLARMLIVHGANRVLADSGRAPG